MSCLHSLERVILTLDIFCKQLSPTIKRIIN
jgi:hypothetical protein